MTNFRPDVHCKGCGRYCYSPLPEDFYASYERHQNYHCGDCEETIKRGMRSKVMLNYTWCKIFWECYRRHCRDYNPSEEDRNNLKRFGGIHQNRRPECVDILEELPFKNDPHAMTKEEWGKIAEYKLGLCSQRQLVKPMTKLMQPTE